MKVKQREVQRTWIGVITIDPKEVLSRAWKIQSEIDTLEKTMAKLKDEVVYLKAMDYSGIVVKHDTSRGSVERDAIQAAEIDERIAKCIMQLWKARAEAEVLIEKLQDGTLRDILRRRYILNERWEEIAVALHFSFRHVTRLHGDALEQLRKMS